MRKFRCLDLFCCLGGASMGYHRAGFDVVGIDLFGDGYTQKRYPFQSIKMDWLEALERYGESADFIHASPPCQRYSITNASRRHDYPDLVGPVREALNALGKPWVMENVLRAPLLDPKIELCGCMFNLTAIDTDGTKLHLWRPRQFESNVVLEQPRPGRRIMRYSTIAAHSEEYHDYAWVAGSYGGARRNRLEARNERKGGYVPSKAVQQQLMGIDWMPEKAMHQALPPVYTEFVGRQILAGLTT
jgi:DNA (cytosine-5)-methyltransferase 1